MCQICFQFITYLAPSTFLVLGAFLTKIVTRTNTLSSSLSYRSINYHRSELGACSHLFILFIKGTSTWRCFGALKKKWIDRVQAVSQTHRRKQAECDETESLGKTTILFWQDKSSMNATELEILKGINDVYSKNLEKFMVQQFWKKTSHFWAIVLLSS